MDSVTADAAAARSLDELASVVRDLLATAYALPIVVVQPEHDQVAVVGAKPLKLVHEALSAVDAACVVELDVAVLAWHGVPADGLRLWRQHGRSGSDGELVTELAAGDPPVQIVTTEQGWRLARAADGAQGWIDPTTSGLDAASEPNERLNDATKVDVESFVEAALALRDAPYVWGGTTAAGVDCSGLVQRAAWQAGSCWLPRHSRALLRAGARVKPSALERGDVLVLQRDPRTFEAEQRAQLEVQAAREQASGAVPSRGPAIHPMHVAIALSADEALHASRDAMRVVTEPLASLRERYRILGVRRLGAAATKETA